jgi:NADPH:quinone reductase-like Zn-dependent oxidoreductase
MKASALIAADQPAAITNLPDPPLAPNAVRILVRATSVNGFDVFQASGGLAGVMEHDLPAVIGRDFAGVVEAVGSSRSDVAAGDEVLGFIPAVPPLHDGSFADRITTSNVVLARKPAGISFKSAAAIPLGDAVAAGSLGVEVQRTFPLEEADQALQAFAGGTAGKVVVVTA